MANIVAMSTGFTSIIAGLILMIYAKFSNKCPEAQSLEIDWKNLQFFKFFKEVTILGTSLYLETIILEISAIIISLLGNEDAIAAHSSVLNCLNTFIEFFYGIGLVTNSIVG